MPNVCTEEQRGINSAAPGGISRSPASPRSRARNEAARYTVTRPPTRRRGSRSSLLTPMPLLKAPSGEFRPHAPCSGWYVRYMVMFAASTEWGVGLIIGTVVILVAAAIVITIVALARRIAEQAATAEEGVEVVRGQTDELGGVARINDSGVRILHAARALRKVAVGK